LKHKKDPKASKARFGIFGDGIPPGKGDWKEPIPGGREEEKKRGLGVFLKSKLRSRLERLRI